MPMTFPRLHGRDDELGRIDRMLAELRTGGGQALVFRGEAGIGKSALLAHAASSADGLFLLRGGGSEGESTLPYAGLHLLLRPVVDHVGDLADTHAETIRRVLAGSDPGGRFAVGAALLELLSLLGRRTPVLVLVDDLHWVDEESRDALSFAARRLAGERVGILAAVREPLRVPAGSVRDVAGMPHHRLSGVDDEAAARILASTELPRHRYAPVIEASRGIPSALLEIGRGGPVGAGPFEADLAALSERARTMLLVAAADDTCDTGTILAAARRLGATLDDLREAEDAGLVMFTDTCFGFSHPLIGPAVYRGATFARRIEAHRALVDVLTVEADADRRGRHLAATTTTSDESVAAELETGVEHARMRGGMAAVADAYERAARLSPAPRDEGRRLTSAARAAADAGQPERARQLADQASALLPDPADATWSAIVRATLAEDDDRPIDAHHTLVGTAKRLAGAAPRDAGRLLVAAAEAAWAADDPDKVTDAAELAETLAVPGADQVRALATAAGGGPAAAVAALRALLEADCAPVDTCTDVAISLRARARSASWWALLGEHDTARAEALELVTEARAHAATGVLPRVLAVLARAQLRLGDLGEAVTTAEEGLATAVSIGQRRGIAEASGVLAVVAGLRGDEQGVARYAADADQSSAEHAAALLDLGAGRLNGVIERLACAVDVGLVGLELVPDLIEAVARAAESGDSVGDDVVDRALANLTTWAAATGSAWGEALAARSAALLGKAEFAAAMAVAGQAGAFEQARTELVHGEWLRRERRPARARAHLRAALSLFERHGATPWAERARTELRAAGERRDSATTAPGADTLTPQERRIAALAADGLSNRDIGARLYLSPRTVGYHLYKAYPKLGVTSRGELAKLELMA
ncbi:regulatory LuxR family protein [Prauserella rugosa]|uniref:Regulatory LuxR family protein n=2 Tax=Prauserella rugosa TaxID=43354 RepID=A0A660CDK1_9PSEU|nr:regulatory LuxR family protein [Prauserella rugosa]